jgi:hypothetical protein
MDYLTECEEHCNEEVCYDIMDVDEYTTCVQNCVYACESQGDRR